MDEYNYDVLLLSEARTLLEEVGDKAMVPMIVNTYCRYCFRRQGQPHTADCLVMRIRDLLGRMAQHGYTD